MPPEKECKATTTTTTTHTHALTHPHIHTPAAFPEDVTIPHLRVGDGQALTHRTQLCCRGVQLRHQLTQLPINLEQQRRKAKGQPGAAKEKGGSKWLRLRRRVQSSFAYGNIHNAWVSLPAVS
eukprot:365022-Chlamydomonas_euryale.AAC.6